MNPYSIDQAGPVVNLRFFDICAGWEQWLLFRSDAHHDSTKCNRELEQAHLQQVLERDALVLDGGDLFDAMQGRYDKRRSQDEVRPEDVCDTYYDSIVLHAAQFYAPYAKHFAMLAKGNHETACERNVGTSLTSNLAHRLNVEHGGRVCVGGYGGWVRLMCRAQSTVQQSIRIKYHHGAGGDAPVTRGTIQTNRQQVYEPDADVIWNGHNHQAYVLPIARERLSDAGKVYQDLTWHIRTPGYKNAFGAGMEGWDIEKGHGPTPQGAVWMHLWLDTTGSRIKYNFLADME